MTPSGSETRRTWKRLPRIANPVVRWALLAVVAGYGVFAALTIQVDPARMGEGLARANLLFGGLLRPDFTTRWGEIREGFIESLAMTATATALGLLLSIPLGLGAARNLVPAAVYGVCRSILAVLRAFHEILLAIFLVAMFGFGPFAGLATLAVGTVGFLGKLLAEAVEEMDLRPLEALSATGAPWSTRVVFAVFPQVMPRIMGLTLYRLDINFRESAVIGLVGAGGIGATLTTAFSRYEFETVSAILILIIALVFGAELLSGRIRRSLL